MKWIQLGVLLATAGCAAGCDGKATAPPRPPLLVRAQTARFEDYAANGALTGSIEPRTQTDLSFRISGRVIDWGPDVGRHVRAGALLAKLDPAQQRADLAAADAAVTSAEAVLRRNSAAFERQQTLLQSGYTTRPIYDAAQQDLTTAQGSLEAAVAQSATAREALSYTELRAPQAGVVTTRDIEVGEVAQVAQRAFTLAVDGPRDAVFNVDEAIFLRNPASGDVRLSLVSNPQIHAVGHVREVEPVVDVKTGTVRVKVGVDDAPPEMALGSAVSGVGAFGARQVVRLSWSAATSENDKLAVWIVDPLTKAVALRPVEAEAYENDALLVRKGLKTGETVVTDGIKFLYPGQIVEVVEAKP